MCCLRDAYADRFGTDAVAIERICRAPRYALRSAGKAAAPALAQLVHSLPRRFEASRHSAFLYVASEIIKIFGDEPARDAELGTWRQLWSSMAPSMGVRPCTHAFTRHASRAVPRAVDLPLPSGPATPPAGPLLTQLMAASCATLRTLADFSAQPDLADDTFLLAGELGGVAERRCV